MPDDREREPTSLTVPDGVDAGGDPVPDSPAPPTGDVQDGAATAAGGGDGFDPAAAVDGTGGGALLSTEDEHTGGPGQELAAGEG